MAARRPFAHHQALRRDVREQIRVPRWVRVIDAAGQDRDGDRPRGECAAVGTFVAAAPPLASLAAAPKLLGPLARWVERARQDGLSAEQIRLLLEAALDEPAASEDDRHAAGGAA